MFDLRSSGITGVIPCLTSGAQLVTRVSLISLSAFVPFCQAGLGFPSCLIAPHLAGRTRPTAQGCARSGRTHRRKLPLHRTFPPPFAPRGRKSLRRSRSLFLARAE